MDSKWDWSRGLMAGRKTVIYKWSYFVPGTILRFLHSSQYLLYRAVYDYVLVLLFYRLKHFDSRNHIEPAVCDSETLFSMSFVNSGFRR